MSERLQIGSIPEWIAAIATTIYVWYYVRSYYRQNPGGLGMTIPWFGVFIAAIDVAFIIAIVWRNKKSKGKFPVLHPHLDSSTVDVSGKLAAPIAQSEWQSLEKHEKELTDMEHRSPEEVSRIRARLPMYPADANRLIDHHLQGIERKRQFVKDIRDKMTAFAEKT